MVPELGEAGRVVSPAPSGRASSTSRLRTQADEEPYKKDKTYKKYASSVDRALALFETTLQEWADYISFLARLLKAIQSHPPNITIVPHKYLVAKRLSQCMNPSLPSGVHQRCMEVYAFVFSLIGNERLASDLPVYLPGLVGTLTFASLSVRPSFLSLLETHILVLDYKALRPAFKSLILCLLPGLDDENSDEFKKVLDLMDKLRKLDKDASAKRQDANVGSSFFWQSFFLATITSISRRQGAWSYLSRNLPKLGGPRRKASIDAASQFVDEEAAAVVIPEPGLLVRCLVSGLRDEQLLIQRGFLDLLVTHVPLHSPVLRASIKPADLDLLLSAAAGVVVRREISLNKRLWAWLLGPDQSEPSDASAPTSPSPNAKVSNASKRQKYFVEYGLDSMVRGLLSMIQSESQSVSSVVRPFRICLSIMDQWEVGSLVIPRVFLRLLSHLSDCRSKYSAVEFKEILRSATMFFDAVPAGLIWSEMLSQLVVGLNKGPDPNAALSLVRFVVQNFNIHEEEMLTIHLPFVALTLIIMCRRITREAAGSSKTSITESCLALAHDLLQIVPQRAFITEAQGERIGSRDGDSLKTSEEDIILHIKEFYTSSEDNYEKVPFSGRVLGAILVDQTSNLLIESLASKASKLRIQLSGRILAVLVSRAPKHDSLNLDRLFDVIHDVLTAESSDNIDFPSFTSFLSVIICLYQVGYLTEARFSDLVEPAVVRIWQHLSPSTPKYHVEAVQLLWQTQSALQPTDRRIEAAICKIISAQGSFGSFSRRDADLGRRFAILWSHSIGVTHGSAEASKATRINLLDTSSISFREGKKYEIVLTRPLFLLLDALQDEGTELFFFVRNWLQSLSSIKQLIEIVLAKLLQFDFLGSQIPSSSSEQPKLFSENDDFETLSYYLQIISSLLQWSAPNISSAMIELSLLDLQSLVSTNINDFGYPSDITLQAFLARICMRTINGYADHTDKETVARLSKLQRTALLVLHHLLVDSHAEALASFGLEKELLNILISSDAARDPYVQISLLEVAFSALKLSYDKNPKMFAQSHFRRPSREAAAQRTTNGGEPAEKEQMVQLPPVPPQTFVKCLQQGLQSAESRPALAAWIEFLSRCLPLFSGAIYQLLIPLVECICTEISSSFEKLKQIYCKEEDFALDASDSTILALLNGLEHALGLSHAKLQEDLQKTASMRQPEVAPGFLSNMVSGVFATETPQSRSATANYRLTILLSFQDSVRICFSIWSWGAYGAGNTNHDLGSSATFTYVSLRMRNRARRILENLFAAEILECIETLIGIWKDSPAVAEEGLSNRNHPVFNLLVAQESTRPKNTIPAIFNALYSRTSPQILDNARKSTLATSLTDIEIVAFLVSYTRTVDDDAMDEIWSDCLLFLRDVLANPFPHRQTLPQLLEFTALLGEKVDNTNFGEQKKMRRELGDLFVRLLTAMFTTKPFSPDALTESPNDSDVKTSKASPNDVTHVLTNIIPLLSKILVDPDRILGAATVISANVVGPVLRSKAFPTVATAPFLEMLYQLARIPNAQKLWKRDIFDGFNDNRFFGAKVPVVTKKWLPLLRQWSLGDKDRMTELLSRITAPTAAGIVFGVGAASARAEADRKTQLNLRRITTMILAADEDTYVINLKVIEEKLVELLGATAASSPSSATRAEVYMVLQALLLKTSQLHLSLFWPIINSELEIAINSIFQAESDLYNNYSILQACKLLDTLLTLTPDDFQLHEWLFISDTIDAMYQTDASTVALANEVARQLHIGSSNSEQYSLATASATSSSGRRPLLYEVKTTNQKGEDIVGKVLRPFFSHLSIHEYESTYSLGAPDLKACSEDLLGDLFDESTIVA